MRGMEHYSNILCFWYLFDETKYQHFLNQRPFIINQLTFKILS